MADNKKRDDDTSMKVGCVLGLVAAAMTVPAYVYETWAALTIWGWLVQVPVPYTLTQLTGANMAVSLVLRPGHRKSSSDEKATETFARLVGNWWVVPTVALGFAWLYAWWAL